MPEALLRVPEVLRRCAIGRSTLFALIARGEFCQPIKVTSRRIAFVESEVETFIQQRIAASRVDAETF